MTQEYLQHANSLLLWIACAPCVIWVVFQAWLFFSRSRKAAYEMGMPAVDVQRAIRSASIASVGPCFVILTTMLTLMLYVGGPVAWIRVDFIGSASYELMSAQFTADAMNIKLGSEAMDMNFLAVAFIVMTTGCVPWVLFAALFADKMDKVNKIMSGGNAALVPILGMGAVIGCFGSLTIDRMVPLGGSTWAAIVAGGLMAVLTLYNKKANIQWLREWGLTICMIAGMVAALLLSD